MKNRKRIVPVFLLMALVISIFPAAVLPSQVSAATCYQAQFVADVTIPDGSNFQPNATFQKVWRLRNIGTCVWNNVTMVFDHGSQLGAATSVPVQSGIAPGQFVDVSVDMTAPNIPDHYLGFWKFRGEQGTVFGIGPLADKAWWVDIKVVGTPTTDVVYDFVAKAIENPEIWSSGAGKLPFPGIEGDTRGFATTGLHWIFEDGRSSPQSSLLVSPPQNIPNGSIQGIFPAYKVQAGDIFRAQVGCELSATSCYVQFRLAYIVDSQPMRTIWRFNERWEGRTNSDYAYPDIMLDDIKLNNGLSLVGRDVQFVLIVDANGSPVGDRALWGNPAIVRKGGSPPPPPGPTDTPSPIPPPSSSCDKVGFVSDVTVPDGTVFSPGATFTKTWRLKNIGSCPWTAAYQLVFYSGEKMGAATSAPFPKNVAVGETVDLSINLTAPNNPDSYRGFWMFKNANGALFGISAQANKPWWVDIKVSGPTVTPGGPTKTPTTTPTVGPTVTPIAGAAYDFAANACSGTWFTGAGQLPCPGTDGDARGFVLKVSNPRLETGATDSRPGILAYPQNVQDGYIQGFFPSFKVQSGDRFRSLINCEGGAKNCYVAFRLDYQSGSDPILPYWGPFLERYEGQAYNVDIDLSPLAGKDVKFILTSLALGTASGDRALWVGPHIYRPSGTSTQPDLAISQIKIELQNPSCLGPGDANGVRVWVLNNGQAAAGGFNVKVGEAQQSVSGLGVGETTSLFFPGFTNPVVVVVDPGGAVAESNEQNNSRSENVPVPTAPLPCTTNSTSTFTPVPSGATQTPTPTPAAGVYQNQKYNFKFTLPTGATVVNQTDSAGRVNLQFTTGTNLSEKYIQVNVVENANPCVSPAVGETTNPPENVTINNIQFVKRTGQDGAAGNIYDWVTYSTTRNNACINLAFLLHSLNPGNFPSPPPVFDKNAESAVFAQVINTFNWINP